MKFTLTLPAILCGAAACKYAVFGYKRYCGALSVLRQIQHAKIINLAAADGK
jgi:hypothetical protein